MTQDDLAKKVGVSRQTIIMVERGDYNPSLKLCIDICKALGVTLNDIFWSEGSN
jgi:putative transcriptional regulator